jgi:6-pyruvoyltetrahydropterin/6-carboxytetrahydropterin synthase
MLLRINRKFGAAHSLPNYEGDCSCLHGHTWRAVFEIEGKPRKDGMICDFKLLRALLDGVLPDHAYLNDILANPTAENICFYLFKKTSALLKKKNLALKTLEIWENEDTAAIIRK